IGEIRTPSSCGSYPSRFVEVASASSALVSGAYRSSAFVRSSMMFPLQIDAEHAGNQPCCLDLSYAFDVCDEADHVSAPLAGRKIRPASGARAVNSDFEGAGTAIGPRWIERDILAANDSAA